MSLPIEPVPSLNYHSYFTEIEERFSARRGSLLLLSTLDWALIETWREAGVPLAAVLRGIDNAFDKHDAKQVRSRSRSRKVNGLAWCAQAVMEAAEQQVDAATGMAPERPVAPAESGFEAERVAMFLARSAEALQRAAASTGPAAETLASTAARLLALATAMRSSEAPALDELDRTLTVLEERLLAALEAALPEADLVALREAADRELAPYRARMGAAQMRGLRAQFVHKRLLERHALPRLSLFYMGHGQ